MKIETVDGTSFETDKMSDIQALILEKGKELHDLCSKSNRQCFIMLDADNRCDGHSYTFFNFNSLKHDIKTQQGHSSLLQTFIYSIDLFIQRLSGDNLSIQPKSKH